MTRRALVSVLALLVALAAFWFWPTDRRRIIAAGRELARAASIPAAEPDLARVARAAALSPRSAISRASITAARPRRIDFGARSMNATRARSASVFLPAFVSATAAKYRASAASGSSPPASAAASSSRAASAARLALSKDMPA